MSAISKPYFTHIGWIDGCCGGLLFQLFTANEIYDVIIRFMMTHNSYNKNNGLC